MIRTSAVVLAALLVLLPRPALAQTQPELPPISAAGALEAERLMAPFFDILAADPARAYRGLFAGTLLETKTVEISQLTAQTNVVLQTYGPITDRELARSECATDRICGLIYVLHTDKGPIGFWAYLHRRSNGDWAPIYVLMGDTPQFFFPD